MGFAAERGLEPRGLGAQRLRIARQLVRGWLRRHRRRRWFRHDLGGIETEVLRQRGDPVAQHRQIRRIGRRVPDQAGPEIERLLPLAALDQGQALIEPGAWVGRLELERAVQRLAGGLGDDPGRGLDRGFGEACLQLGAAGVERQGMLIGQNRFRRLVDQLIGARQPAPALEVGRCGLDPLLEVCDQLLDRGQARLGAGGLGVIATLGKRQAGQLGTPEALIDCQRQRRQRQQQDQRGRQAPPAAGTARSGPGVIDGVGGEHPPLDLEAGRPGFVRAKQTALLVPLELPELGAIDAEVVLAPGRDRARPAQQRPQGQRQHQAGQRDQDRPEAHPALLERRPRRRATCPTVR